MWIISGVISIALLIVYSHSRNAIWGGLTLGLVIGFIIVLSGILRGTEATWIIIGKSGIAGTLIGFGAELLGIAGSRIFKSKTK
jgi:hypothetical protein